MSGLLRSARPPFAWLLSLALVAGVNGFAGAVHSAHHPPTAALAHEHGGHDGGHGRPDTGPSGAPDGSCPVADAALHLAASGVAALAALDLLPPETEFVAGSPVDAPRQAAREPGSGRAPPSLQSTAT